MSTTAESILASAQNFVDRAQAPEYELGHHSEWVFVTYTVPRPGETKWEVGRKSHLHAANLSNMKLAGDFVAKHLMSAELRATLTAGFKLFNSDVTETQLQNFLRDTFVHGHFRALTIDRKAYIKLVEDAVITQWGKARWDQAKSEHRQPFRLAESIASWLEQTLTWAYSLHAYTKGALPEVNAEIETYCSSTDSILHTPEGGPLMPIKLIRDIQLQNIKAQDVKSAGRKLLMVNGSAGCVGEPEGLTVQDANGKARNVSDLERGGGVFGDPCHSCTTQEEDVVRTLPVSLVFFVQFGLGEFVQAITTKGAVCQFMYQARFAPANGTVLALDTGDTTVAITAAVDQTKTPTDYEAQKAAYTMVYEVIARVAAVKKVTTIIGGAFGIGVFGGSPKAQAEGLQAALIRHSAPDGHPLEYVYAYFVTDSKGQANYDIVQRTLFPPVQPIPE